jgi:hypothetical protein
VGQERAHAKLGGQCTCLLVRIVGWFDPQGPAPGGDLAEEPEGIRLHAPLLAFAGEREGPVGTVERFLHAAA